jgi:hypothetical protein
MPYKMHFSQEVCSLTHHSKLSSKPSTFVSAWLEESYCELTPCKVSVHRHAFNHGVEHGIEVIAVVLHAVCIVHCLLSGEVILALACETILRHSAHISNRRLVTCI